MINVVISLSVSGSYGFCTCCDMLEFSDFPLTGALESTHDLWLWISFVSVSHSPVTARVTLSFVIASQLDFDIVGHHHHDKADMRVKAGRSPMAMLILK